MEEKLGRHPCPVCGRTIFEEYDSYVICEFCGWEDNALQEEEPDLGGGPNASLNDCRKQYQEKIKADPNYTWLKSVKKGVKRRGSFGSSIGKT